MFCRLDGIQRCCAGYKLDYVKNICIRRLIHFSAILKSEMIFKYFGQYMWKYLGDFGYRLGCEEGFYGTNCGMKCSFPTYGLDCQSLCNCNVTYCHHVNGCIQSLGKTLVVTELCYVLFLVYIYEFIIIKKITINTLRNLLHIVNKVKLTTHEFYSISHHIIVWHFLKCEIERLL